MPFWTIPTLQPRLTVPHIFVAASSTTFFPHARLNLNTAKTAFWNAADIVHAGLAQHDCERHGWVGDPALDPSERGLVVLGVPIGSPDFVRKHLHLILERQASLLDQLSALEDFAERLTASLAGRNRSHLRWTHFAWPAISAAGFDLPAWRDLSHMPCPHCRTMTQASTSLVDGSDPRPVPLTTLVIGPSDAAGGAWTPSVRTWQHAHALGCCAPMAGLLRGQPPAPCSGT